MKAQDTAVILAWFSYLEGFKKAYNSYGPERWVYMEENENWILSILNDFLEFINKNPGHYYTKESILKIMHEEEKHETKK